MCTVARCTATGMPYVVGAISDWGDWSIVTVEYGDWIYLSQVFNYY